MSGFMLNVVIIGDLLGVMKGRMWDLAEEVLCAHAPSGCVHSCSLPQPLSLYSLIQQEAELSLFHMLLHLFWWPGHSVKCLRLEIMGLNALKLSPPNKSFLTQIVYATRQK